MDGALSDQTPFGAVVGTECLHPRGASTVEAGDPAGGESRGSDRQGEPVSAGGAPPGRNILSGGGMRRLKYWQAISEATVQCMEADPTILIAGIGVDDHKGIFGTTRDAFLK